MSFNIPVLFDESPFFEWNEMQRPMRRQNFERRRRPGLFEQWAEPFHEYSTRKQHHRPNESETRTGYENPFKNYNRYRFEGEGDVFDSEEETGIGRSPRDNFGWDGWEIPVQYMDRKTRPHHKHKQTRRKVKQEKSDETPQETRGNEPPPNDVPSNEAPSNKVLADDVSSNNDATNDENAINRNKQSEVNEDMEQKSADANAGPSSQITEDNESIEVPITFSGPKNTPRKLTKQLSQCDPPSPADIKLARIKSILERMNGIEENIAEFVDTVQNKKYLYISETLMRILLDLDTVDSEGFENVRQARKEGVCSVQALVDKLEGKLEENKKNQSELE